MFGKRKRTFDPVDQDDDEKPPMWKLGFKAGVAAALSFLIAVAFMARALIEHHATGIEEVRTLGTPMRAQPGGVSALFLVSAQKEVRTVPGLSRWRPYRDLETVTHFDLWRFDSKTAQPVWRKRLLTEKGAINLMNTGILGADGERLWMFLREPMVVAAANGEVLHGANDIEARNPPLRGVLPRERGHYRFFDGYGLVFTAADARAWWLNGETLHATAWEPKSAARRASAIGAPSYAPSSSTFFQKRGLLLTGNWLGVLTDDEASALNGEVKVPGAKPGERRGAMAAYLEYHRAPPQLDHSGPKRYRLWRAEVEQISAAPADWPKNFPDNWGKRPRYGEFIAFAKSPEFLQAGLLSDGRSALPLLLQQPDSVLVLHRDRIDKQGRLHLTRIAGPDGRTLWNAELPLSVLQTVVPGSGTVLLFGRRYVQPLTDTSDPYNSAHEWLASVDLGSGAVSAFNISQAGK